MPGPAEKSANKGWVTTDVKLTGKTVLITGANTGIGLETAIDIAKRDARVILACRNLDKAMNAKTRIIQESGNQNIILKTLDLASFESIRSCAEEINAEEQRLDILINNAGLLSPHYRETEQGHEMHFGVNHLGHFLLTNLLIDLLKCSAPSRIVVVSSMGHRTGTINWSDPNRRHNYNNLDAYGQSKLMNVLFSRELSKRLEGTGVTCNSLHPGIVSTEITRDVDGCCALDGFIGCITTCIFCTGCLFVTPEEGAQTTIYCAVAPELDNVTGKYFQKCKVTQEHSKARRDEDAKRLWELSEKLCEIQTTI